MVGKRCIALWIGMEMLNYNIKFNFLHAALIPLFFPFVGFMPGVDTQPVFILYVLVVFPFYCKSLNVNVTFLFMFFLSCTFILVCCAFDYDYLNSKYLITYAVSLLTLFFIYISVLNGYFNITLRFVTCVSVIYAGVGFVQIIYPDFLANVVYRSVEAALSYSTTGRGVRSLTGEPAALGKVFTTLNVLYVFLIYQRGGTGLNRKSVIASFLFLLVSAMISRSTYALLIHSMLIVVLLFLVNKRLLIFLVVSAILFSSSLFAYMDNFVDVRAVKMITLLVNEPSLLLNQGAMRRVMNILISFNNLRYFGFAGAGNDPSVFLSSIVTPFGLLYYEAFNRNLGGFVEFVLKFGVFSLPLMILYFFMLFKIFLMRMSDGRKTVRLGLFFGVSVFALTFQDSSTALPLSWFIVVYLYAQSLNSKCNTAKISVIAREV